MMYYVLILLILLLLIYKTWKSTQYWKERGIKYKSSFPFIGDFKRVVFKQQSFFEIIIDLYNDFPNERYHGTYQFTIPALIIKDLELIKQIGVKSFDSFMNHRQISQNKEEFTSKILIQLAGEEWREMRATLSPAFTGSKMKAMFPLMCECADSLTSYFVGKNQNIIEMEMKELLAKYTNDVIATCAFGVQCDSIRDDKNTFFRMGRKLTQPNSRIMLRMMIISILPKFCTWIGLKMFSDDVSNFFVDTVSEAIEYRRKHGIVRPDMIHLLMEARKGKLKHEETEDVDKSFAALEESEMGKMDINMSKELTDLDLAAQAFIFFFAGFETSSTLMCFMAHELAVNPDIQDKLFEEVKQVMEDNNNKPSYEAVNNMKYLDMVVSETLRKWPAAPVAERICNKEFVVAGVKPDEPSYTIQVGDVINIPILGLHRDPKHFANPMKFDPERFSDDRKHEIEPYSYLPFGIGPRACIGSRFALLEIKILFTYLLAKMELTVVEKTVVPLVLSKRILTTQPDEGFWLGLKTRNN